jgi:hypothetical protein
VCMKPAMRVGCKRAKEEVELLEMEKRAGGRRHVGRHREPRVKIVRIHPRQDTHAREASKECHLACVSRARGCVDWGWIRDGCLSRQDLHAGARGASAYRRERGVYASQRCEDRIAEYAQVVVHAARDTLAWSATGCGVGVDGEGAPNMRCWRGDSSGMDPE